MKVRPSEAKPRGDKPTTAVSAEMPRDKARPTLALAASDAHTSPASEQVQPRGREAADAPAAKAPAGEAAVPNATTAAKAPKRSGLKRALLVTAGIAALLTGGWYGYRYWTVGRFIVSTDDAYVEAYMAMISPKVAANVVEVPVVDNQPVKAGDVLVRLDDGDFKLALDQATTKLATQHAAIATFDAQIRSAEAGVAQARAQLVANQATLAKAEADFQRTNTLAARDYSPKATLDAMRAARDSARAQVTAQDAAIASAQANVAVLTAQKTQAEEVAKELQVAVDKAQRDLSFTVIKAPFDGVVGNRAVQVGDYVTPGKRLAALVPLDRVYVDANLKETQLAHVAAGEHVTVHVDALDGRAIDGTVTSIAPASGSQFSLLPPENATGNFTKIVQRVPVRIALDAKEAEGRLRPGLSVIVDIDTRTSPTRQPRLAADEAARSKR